MSIAYGFFSPLEGFMPWNEVESVLRERRLLSGWLFPFLVVFDVSEEELKVSGARQVDDLLLTLKGRPFAALKVEEVYKLPDRWELAAAVFGFWRGSCGLWFLPLAVTGFTAESCR